MKRTLIISTLIVFCTFAAVFGQRQPATGFQAANPYVGGGFDAVNVRNGNVVINLPLASLPPGRGTAPGASITLQYNSKLWSSRQTNYNDYVQGGQSSYVYTSNTLELSDRGGWKMLMGFQMTLTDRLSLESPNPCLLGDPVEKLAARWKLEMEMPDGRVVQFMPATGTDLAAQVTRDGYYSTDPTGKSYSTQKLTNPANGICYIGYSESQSTTGMNYIADDGSRMRLFVPYSSGNWKLYSLDGTVVENAPPDDTTIAQRITDRNGNKVDFKANQIVDQLGRSITITGESPNTYITVHGIGGEDVTTQLVWGNKWVYRHYKAIGNNVDETVPSGTERWAYVSEEITTLSQIILPTQAGGQSYYFDYYADTSQHTGTNYTDGWGELKSVTLPTEAKTTYTYEVSSVGDIEAQDVLDDKAIYKDLEYDEIYDGSTTHRTDHTTFTTSPGFWSVTAPDGSSTGETSIHYTNGGSSWDEGLASSSSSPDGSVTERIWKYNLINFPGSYGISSYSSGNVNGYVKTEFTSISGSLTAIRDYNYDKNGNVTRIAEYDWVAYSTVPRTSGKPTAIPSGIIPKRVTINEYYNQAPDADSTSTSSYTYENPSSPKLKNVIKSTEIQDGSGNVKSRTEFYYDDYSNTGNLTETRAWDSTKDALASPDSNGSKLTSGNSISTYTTYSTYGAPTLTTDANGNHTQITYGNVTVGGSSVTGPYPTQTVSAYGTSLARTTTAVYDFYTGSTTSTTDVDNGVTNAMVYDDLGRPTKAITAQGTSLESWTTTEYHDADRFVVVKSDLETKGDGKKVATQFYDQLGRVRLWKTLEDAASQSATNETDGIKVQTRYKTDYNSSTGVGHTYQLTSNPFRAAHPMDATGETTMGWTLSTGLNTHLHSEVDTFTGATLPAPFLSSGYNTASTGKVQSDIDANATTVTDQANKLRRSITNSLGQLERVDEPTSSGLGTVSSPSQPTGYTYDVLNNLLTVTQAGSGTEQCGPAGGSCSQTRTFSYSSLSRLLTATNPESGTISYGYDPNGNLTSKVDARSITTTYTYNALNQVTDRDYSDSTPDVDYIYGDTAPKIGKLVKVTNGTGADRSTTEYTAFDILGRVTAHKQTTDGNDYTTGYTYNLGGAMIEETYPSTRVVKNVLDNNGDLSIVESKKNSSSGYWHYADSFSYNAAGAVTSMQLGNGRWESTVFNSRLQPTQIALGTLQNGTDKLNLIYSYGDWNGSSIDATRNNGNIVQQVITVPTVGSNSGFAATQKYYYDSLNRIDDSTETISSTQTWRQDFTYDRYGNRNFNQTNTTMPASFANPAVTNPTISTSNNRITSSGYNYDSSGNTTYDAALRKFTYDAENKQTKVESTNSSQTVTGTVGEYFYDGDGKRVKKYVPSSGETTIFVYDATGKQIAEYSTIIANSTDAKVAYVTNDHLGSPRINTDANGAVTSRHDYHPFGEEIATATRTAHTEYTPDTVRKQFTGYERDDETGLDFAEARMYNSGLGRFSVPDPLLASGRPADPQTYNRYSYVGNHPLKFTDPSGLEWYSRKNKNGSTSIRWYGKGDEVEKDFHIYFGEFQVPVADGSGRYIWLNSSGPNKKGKTDFEKNGWAYGGAPIFMQAGLQQVGTDTMEGSKNVTLDLVFAAQGFSSLLRTGAGFFAATNLRTAATGTAETALAETPSSILKPFGELIGTPGTKEAIRELPGGVEGARSIFGRLLSNGSELNTATSYRGSLFNLPNGGTVGWRTAMSRSPQSQVTIDVNIPGVLRNGKLKF